jgi:hypothetical protein
MSTLALFAVGLAVSVVVFAALALLLAGAVLDGRDERARREAEAAAAASVTPLRPAASIVPVPTTEGEAA